MSYLRFTNDGWYSRLDEDFCEPNVARIADAVAAFWYEQNPKGTVYIGFDTRQNAGSYAAIAAKAQAAWGLRTVVSDGPCPMPALNEAVREDPEAIGALMLTADHRSADYLGVRVRNADSSAISSEDAAHIEDLVSAEVDVPDVSFEVQDFVSPFLATMSSIIDVSLVRDAHLTAVVDPLFGTARGIAAPLLRSFGVDAMEIHSAADANFGGLHPEVVEPWVDDLEYLIGQTRSSFGVAIDGPSNRSILVDERGQLVSAPQAHGLLLEHLVKHRGLSGRIVVPRFSSAMTRRLADRLGCEVVAVASGPTWPFDEIRRDNVLTASDGLGGICVPTFDRERNAFVTMLLLMEYIAAEKKPLSLLVDEFCAQVGKMEFGSKELQMDPGKYAVLRNLLPGVNPVLEGVGKEPVSVSHADGLRVQYEDDSWLLVKPSLSEPLVRIYAEGPTKAERDNLLDGAKQLLKQL